MTLDHHTLMQDMPHYREKYEAQKKINVYFIPASHDETKEKMFFYAIVSASLHDEMLQCLNEGIIPDFAVIVERGEGIPSQEVKDKIKAYYGFDHDLHAKNDNRPAPQSEAAAN